MVEWMSDCILCVGYIGERERERERGGGGKPQHVYHTQLKCSLTYIVARRLLSRYHFRGATYILTLTLCTCCGMLCWWGPTAPNSCPELHIIFSLGITWFSPYMYRCRESWLAVKDSLTHHPPGSQDWAPSVLLSCHVVCICVCVFCVDILGFVYNYIMLVVVFIYFSIYLSTYDWYAMNYNFTYFS